MIILRINFLKYILGNYICKCQTFIKTYNIAWYRLSNLLKYKPNCPYRPNPKNLHSSQGSKRKSTIYNLPPPYVHIYVYVRTILKEISISFNIYSPIMCTISISLFFFEKKACWLMRNARRRSGNIDTLRLLMRTTIQNKSFCPKYYTICVVSVWLSTIFLPPLVFPRIDIICLTGLSPMLKIKLIQQQFTAK